MIEINIVLKCKLLYFDISQNNVSFSFRLIEIIKTNMAVSNIHKVHREGRGILFCLFVVFATVDILLFLYAKLSIFYLVLSFTVLAFALVANFFRNPKRKYIGDPLNSVVAPYDGESVTIEEVYEGEYFKDKRIQVSIFMTVFNVHAQWAPMTG